MSIQSPDYTATWYINPTGANMNTSNMNTVNMNTSGVTVNIIEIFNNYKIEIENKLLKIRNDNITLRHEVIDLRNEIISMKTENLKKDIAKYKPFIDERNRNKLIRQQVPFGFVPETK